jgi:hypothetical protein
MHHRRAVGATVLAVGLFVAFGGKSARACVGDCNLDANVTVDEVVRGVNVLLDLSAKDIMQKLEE